MNYNNIKFCQQCGCPLVRALNKRYDGTCADFCNAKHEKAHERSGRVKNRKKYGIAGYCYDGYSQGDIFKKREGT